MTADTAKQTGDTPRGGNPNAAVRILAAREENNFPGARQFMHRWDFFRDRPTPSALGTIRSSVKRSETGNLNIRGTNYASTSTMFISRQDGFLDVVEKGVRAWVELFAIAYDMITYTSCEGHDYGNAIPPDQRHVGIIPRSDAEYRICRDFFMAVAEHWNRTGQNHCSEAAIMEGRLRDRDADLPTLDFYLIKIQATSWADYFRMLDTDTGSLLETFRHVAGRMQFPPRAP